LPETVSEIKVEFLAPLFPSPATHIPLTLMFVERTLMFVERRDRERKVPHDERSSSLQAAA
jgi:hypothetical protein